MRFEKITDNKIKIFFSFDDIIDFDCFAIIYFSIIKNIIQ